MNIIKQGLDNVLNKNWNYIIKSDLVLDDIKVHKSHAATLYVIDISHITKQKCYFVIAINRETRTIMCTTTQGDIIDCQVYRKLVDLTENGHEFACVVLRLKCNNNKIHEAFVIYLADMFSNTTYNPLSKLLSDSEILRKYNIFNHEHEKLDESNNDSI